jgi:hypothetical protein
VSKLDFGKVDEAADHDIEYDKICVSCPGNSCGWTGYMEECEVRFESESWECPQEYLVLVCPKCGENVDY